MIESALRNMGRVAIFLLRLLRQTGVVFTEPRAVIHQIYNCGARSLVIIMLCGLFVGMVLGLQGFDLLQRFGSEDALGVAAALGLLKELGPVVTALLFAGRAGTALASEIGLMRATDQITALGLMAIDPVGKAVAPRFWAAVITVPLLTAIFCSLAFSASWFQAVQILGIDNGAFWQVMKDAVDVHEDFLPAFLKSAVFGGTAALVASYVGYHAEPTIEGTSVATTRAVVNASLLVLMFNFVLSAFLFR